MGKRATKTQSVLLHIENRNVIGQIKHELYTITVTNTNVVISTPQYTYSANSTSNMYIHFLGLIELHNKVDKTQEEQEIYENILEVYTSNINWHVLWFTDVELASKVYNLHIKYLNERFTEAMEAELQDDNPAAIQEMADLDKFVQQAEKEIEEFG